MAVTAEMLMTTAMMMIVVTTGRAGQGEHARSSATLKVSIRRQSASAGMHMPMQRASSQSQGHQKRHLGAHMRALVTCNRRRLGIATGEGRILE